LRLEEVTLSENNWGHLTTYLIHQISDNQTLSLEVFGDFPRMPPEVVDEIKGLVEEFTTYSPNPEADDGELSGSCGHSTDKEDE